MRFAQKRDCHGVLDRAWFSEALPAKKYPPQKYDFVMELMEKFEVAFALDGPGGLLEKDASGGLHAPFDEIVIRAGLRKAA